MKIIKILCNKHTCFIFSRNVSTFPSVNTDMTKLKKDSCSISSFHRLQRENRFMYGAVTRKKRQTLETSTNTSQNNNTSMNSELWWHLKNSKCVMKPYTIGKRVRITKVKRMEVHKKMANLDHASKCNIEKAVVSIKEDITINSVTSKNFKEVETTYDKQDTKNKNNNTLEMVDVADKLKIPSLENIELLEVLINNMTLFPILNLEKKLPQIADKMDILSISAEDEPTTLGYPSITKILAETLSPQSQKALELWKTRLIAEMGEDKFNEYYQEQLKTGSLFHSCIENTLYGRSVDIPDKIQPAFNSLSNVVKGLKDIRAIESHVSHKHLRYKGKIDCVAVYRGKLCVIDWKKSDKDKSSLASTYDAPIQIAAYIGALNYSNSYPFKVECGLIVVGYTDGKPANTYLLKNTTLKTYWNKWLTRLQRYWTSVSKNV